MKNILKTLAAHKYAIIWSVCYIAMMWAVLKFLFNFDMFSIHYWQHLLHAQLRGFPGFVFGIFILAALPLYIATATLIIRTKKPLFTISVPGFMKTIWSRMQPTLINPPTPETPKEEKKEETQPTIQDELPTELPSELRTAYIHTRMRIAPEQRSAFNQPTVTAQEAPQLITNIPEPEIQEIPLPTDFNLTPVDGSEFTPDNFANIPAPTFTDITFEDESKNVDPISEHLNAKNIAFEIIDDIIITDKYAIASHTDNDFWVCDEDYWFATGKQKESPIAKISKVARERNLSPVLYLGSENILNIDTMRKTWESSGITVITTPDTLPE